MCCRLSCGLCYVFLVPLDCFLCRRFPWFMLYVLGLSGLFFVL